MPKEVYIPLLKIRIGRFFFLFISIVLMFACRPFMGSVIRLGILTDILFTVILVSGLWAISQKKSILTLGFLLAILAILLGGAAYLTNSTLFQQLGRLSVALFILISLVTILSHVLRAKEVTADLVMGAASAYFLFGFLWTFVYYFLEMAVPNSFALQQGQENNLGQLIYYSFVTLTTLGYGDITPLTNQARSLAILEAIIGQLYLAVLVARLVGMHIAHSMQKR
jgi:hypothetical protein